MEQLRAIAVGIAIFGGVYDFFTNRIPNWWTYPAMAIGICISAFYGGWTGAGMAALAVLAAFFLYFFLFVFGVMGAGDVKLLMAIGAFAEPKFIFWVAIVAIFVGGVYAVIDLIFAGRLVQFVRNLLRFVRPIFFPAYLREPLELNKDRKFSYGVSIAIATGIVVWLEHGGRL